MGSRERKAPKDHTKMTMRELIYYLPVSNPMKYVPFLISLCFLEVHVDGNAVILFAMLYSDYNNPLVDSIL